MWPFTPAWKSENEEKALKAVAKITDQDTLVLVAKTASSFKAIRAAIRKINSIDALIDLAEAYIDQDAVQERLEMLFGAMGDKSIFNEWAQNHSNLTVRIAAVNNVTDQRVLVDAILNSSDFSLWEYAIKNISDQDLLVEIVENCRIHDSVRKTAAIKVQDLATQQNMYVLLAKSCASHMTRRSIVGRLNEHVEQRALAEIAIHSPWYSYWNGRETGETESEAQDTEPSVRIINDLLNDSEWLEYVGQQADNNDVQIAAKRKLYRDVTDQSKLVEIAKTDEHSAIRYEAMKKVTDLDVLASVAREDSSQGIRQAAVERITDQSVLAEIAATDYENYVARAALARLTEPVAILTVARMAREEISRDALKKLTDQAALSEIAKTGQWDSLRVNAIKRLTDPTLLTSIAETAPNRRVREAAAERLNTSELRGAVREMQEKQKIRDFQQDGSVKCLSCQKEIPAEDKKEPMLDNGILIAVCMECRSANKFYESNGHLVLQEKSSRDGHSRCLICGASCWYTEEGEHEGTRFSVKPCKP